MAIMAVIAFGQSPQNRQNLSVKKILVQDNRTSLLQQARRLPADVRPASPAVSENPVAQPFHMGSQQPLPLKKVLKPQRPNLKSTLAAGEDLITSQPEGELRTYTRSGMCYYSEDFITYDQTQQVGNLDIVFAPDGKTVYLKEFISALSGLNTWVSGTLSEDGKQITVPTGQNIFYMDDLGTYLTLNIVVYDDAEKAFKVDNSVKEILLKVEDNVIAVENTNEHRVVGMVFANDNQWACFGDYESVYTLFDDTPLTPPSGLPSVKYILQGTDGYESPIAYSADMVFDGNDVYINGTGGYYCPNAWVKGTKDGNTITVPSGQYLGRFEGNYMTYMVSGKLDLYTMEISIADMVLEYDSASGNYTTEQDIILADSKEGNNFYNFFQDLVFVKSVDISFSKEVIATQPEGEVKTYVRKGEGYFADRGAVMQTTQAGYIMNVTYAPDGKTVYMLNPISQVMEDTWVKGTIDGNKITVPALQCLAYSEAEGYGILTAQLDLVEKVDPSTSETYVTYEPNFDVKEFTFTIDPKQGTISLDGLTTENSIYGCIMSDNYMWPGFGDFASVYEPLNDQPTLMPEGLETQKWSLKYDDGYQTYSRLIDLAIDGNKIYLNGLSIYDPESVICGTIEGDAVTFPSGQYLGRASDVALYFTGAHAEKKTVSDEFGEYEAVVYTYLPKLTFHFDANRQMLTPEEGQSIMVYCGKDFTTDTELANYMLACLNPELRVFVDKAAQPADPVIDTYNDSFWESMGFSWISMTMLNQDVDGNYIDPAKLAYQLFIKVGEEVSPYTLYMDEYPNLTEDMDIIPFEFTDGNDILPRGANIALYQTGFDDIGVQLINYSGGKEMRSNLVWYKGGIETAIAPVLSDHQAVESVTYYNLNGVKINRPTKGLYLQSVVYKDGSTRTFKRFKK